MSEVIKKYFKIPFLKPDKNVHSYDTMQIFVKICLVITLYKFLSNFLKTNSFKIT